MNTQKYIVSSLIWLVMVATTYANEIPAEFNAFKSFLGEWSGTVALQIRTSKGVEKFKYPKSSVCHFDPQRGAIVINDSELNPWTKENVKATAEIKWDKSSKRFKAIHWGTDGCARLFVIEKRGDALFFQQVDPAPGDKLESETSINHDGKLVEKGVSSLRDEAGTVVEWSVTYDREGKNAD